MNTFALEVWDDEGACTTFYTIRKSNSSQNETDKFFLKYRDDPEYQENVRMLATFIFDTIGAGYGAKRHFFRFENAAEGLPPKGRIFEFNFSNFPLRLYCMRLCDGIVILMNGGVKSSETAQGSPALKRQFDEANRFAKAIDEAMRERELEISANGKSLCSNEDLEDLEFYY